MFLTLNQTVDGSNRIQLRDLDVLGRRGTFQLVSPAGGVLRPFQTLVLTDTQLEKLADGSQTFKRVITDAALAAIFAPNAAPIPPTSLRIVNEHTIPVTVTLRAFFSDGDTPDDEVEVEVPANTTKLVSVHVSDLGFLTADFDDGENTASLGEGEINVELYGTKQYIWNSDGLAE